MTAPAVKIILLEYSPSMERVFVRGCWPDDGKEHLLTPLDPENFQNYVKVFEGVDMRLHCGFTGLIPNAPLSVKTV